MKKINILDLKGLYKLQSIAPPEHKNVLLNKKVSMKNTYPDIHDMISKSLKNFTQKMGEIPLVAALIDNDGMILDIHKSDALKCKDGQQFQIGLFVTEQESGQVWLEQIMREKKSITIIGEEHDLVSNKKYVTYSVPILDKESNSVVGIITIGTLTYYANPTILPFLEGIVAMVEEQLIFFKERSRLILLNELLIDSTLNGVVLLNTDFKIIDVNQFAKNLFNLKNENYKGTDIRDVNILNINFETVFLNKITKTDIEFQFTKTNNNGQEQTLYLVMDVFPLVDNHTDQLQGVCLFIKNVTQDKLLQVSLEKDKKQAEKSNEEKSNFIYNMSHELRTPLNAIYGFSQLLSMNANQHLSFEELHYVKDIHKASKNLLNTVNALVNFIEIENNQYQIEKEPLNICSITKEVIEMLNPSLNEKEIDVKLISPDCKCIPAIQGDYAATRQIMWNVISNAIKFNKEKGSILFKCKNNDTHLEFTVTDNGIGISAEDITKIFDRFYRSKQCTNIVEGAGIGLAVTKKLVEMMDGYIRVDSVQGAGSQFIIGLKLAE